MLKNIKNKYGFNNFQIAFLIFQVSMTLFGVFLCVARFTTELSALGYAECALMLIALLSLVWYVFVGYKKGELVFNIITLLFAVVILFSTVVSTVIVEAPVLVALSMISFGLVLSILNMKSDNKYRSYLVKVIIILEFVIWAFAFFYLGEPGASFSEAGFLGFIKNVYMINRFFIACMLGLCYLAHEKKMALNAQ
jgi:hypothetical protein